MSLQSRLNEIIPADIKQDLGQEDEIKILAVQLGSIEASKSTSRETKSSEWDDTSTTDVIYKKYPDGVIEKLDLANKTRTYNVGGTWADRTTLTYTEWGS